MSKSDLIVGNLAAKPGQKTYGVQEFSVAGSPFKLPMFLINGAHPGSTVTITGGIHAAEYASIAAALEFAQNLDPNQLSGQVIVIPVVNMPGFRARSIYVCPLDGVNPNRVFPGKADGSATEQIAHWVFQNAMKQANYYIDMHGGDLVEALVPFTIFARTGVEEVDQGSFELAKTFGIHYLVRSETVGSTISAAARAGIPAILTEAGGQGIWKRSDVEIHLSGLNRVLQSAGMLPGGKPQPLSTTLLEQFIWLRSEHEGFYYPAVEVGDTVKKDQLIGKITDYEGNILQSVVAPADGSVLFLVSSLAINQGDPLLSIGA